MNSVIKKPFATLFMVMALLSSGWATESFQTFTNPVLRGFYPDPSICRVGDDYYLVNSSFEYFPGVPIFHSKDFVNWEQIGHVLTRKSQLNLDTMRSSGGIYAPTLRHHNGLFYMVTTLIDGGGNFYVTAKDPAGPWSDPIWLDRPGIDPSLLFDDDGKVYYTRHVGMGDGHIATTTLDIKTGKLESELKEVWKGTGGVWPEGPHLYKIKGKYYLMIAEGGTSYEHMVTVARSDSPWGPFESNPQNPVLTHRNRPEHSVQALGHADLVETRDGWWALFLGVRPQGGKFHHLGRETFLAPVVWNEDGWPIIGSNGSIELTMPAPRLPKHSRIEKSARDEFQKTELGLQWNFLRNPYEQDFSLTKRKGWLRLNGSAVTMNDRDSPAFVGRRQTDLSCKISTRISFSPQYTNEEAGLVLRQNEKNHYDLGVTLRDGRRQAFLRRTIGGQSDEGIVFTELTSADLVLEIKTAPLAYEFSIRADNSSPEVLGSATTQALSSEKAGGFTGVYIGMYATGNGKASTRPADFDWFEYQQAGN